MWISRRTTAACATGMSSSSAMTCQPPSACSQSSSVNVATNAEKTSERTSSSSGPGTCSVRSTRMSGTSVAAEAVEADFPDLAASARLVGGPQQVRCAVGVHDVPPARLALIGDDAGGTRHPVQHVAHRVSGLHVVGQHVTHPADAHSQAPAAEADGAFALVAQDGAERPPRQNAAGLAVAT